MMTRYWFTLAFPTLTLASLVFAVVVERTLIPYMIIAVACVVPLAVCFMMANRVPRIVLAIIYVLCSAATIWFLASAGDHLLPAGTSTGGRYATDATGGFLAAWTGVMSALFGLTAVSFMIADARELRRKARLTTGGVHPNARHARRQAKKP
jgi:hypothetical protein